MVYQSVIFFSIQNLPSGSAFPAIWRASEFAKSEFAGVTARIRQLGVLMYDMIIVLIRASISDGWSPTGTFVIPGRSTSVISRTFGEKIFRRICLSETPLLPPASLSVSAYSPMEIIQREKKLDEKKENQDIVGFQKLLKCSFICSKCHLEFTQFSQNHKLNCKEQQRESKSWGSEPQLNSQN